MMSTDYMDQPHEIAKHPDAKQVFQYITQGNQDAFNFLWSIWNWMHIVDDLLDRDTAPLSEEVVTRGFITYTLSLSHNAFFLANRDSLTTHIVSLANRFIDGNAWEKSDVPGRRQVSQLLKCGDMDLYLHVAFLIGGWDFMRHCSLKFRTFDDNFTKE